MHTACNCIRVLEGSLLTIVFIVESLDLVSIYLPLLPSLSSLSSSTSLSPLSLSLTSKFHHSHKVEHSDLSHWWLDPSSRSDCFSGISLCTKESELKDEGKEFPWSGQWLFSNGIEILVTECPQEGNSLFSSDMGHPSVGIFIVFVHST